MVLEVGEVKEEAVKKYEKFLITAKYKELAQNTQSFSRWCWFKWECLCMIRNIAIAGKHLNDKQEG